VLRWVGKREQKCLAFTRERDVTVSDLRRIK
jgi:hypothetical protein